MATNLAEFSQILAEMEKNLAEMVLNLAEKVYLNLRLVNEWEASEIASSRAF